MRERERRGTEEVGRTTAADTGNDRECVKAAVVAGEEQGIRITLANNSDRQRREKQ